MQEAVINGLIFLSKHEGMSSRIQKRYLVLEKRRDPIPLLPWGRKERINAGKYIA